MAAITKLQYTTMPKEHSILFYHPEYLLTIINYKM